jgi:haloalkane dehalogenase
VQAASRTCLWTHRRADDRHSPLRPSESRTGAYALGVPLLDVLDTTMYYEEAGSGPPIVCLHGNPTSSYLWRSVLPGLAGHGRVLAPDLVGFGRSGKPDISYRFKEHARYLDAWFDALDLRDVTIVGHDWGGALGFHWAARQPNRVAGIAFFETIVKPLTWEEWPESGVDLFQRFRTPGVGEKLILEQNFFVEGVLPAAVVRELSAEEVDAYREPFRDREARRSILQWPRELPMEGEPADVVALVEDYDRWLASSGEVPKLLLTFEPGAIIRESVIRWCRDNVAALEVRHVGAGAHFVQEDQGPAIAEAVAEWHRRVVRP